MRITMIHEKLSEIIQAFNINFDADSNDPMTDNFFTFAQLQVNLWAVYSLKDTPYRNEAIQVAKDNPNSLISIGVMRIIGEEIKTIENLPEDIDVAMCMIDVEPSVQAVIDGFNKLSHTKHAVLEGTKVVFYNL